MMVSLKSFVLQHPKTVVAITMLAIVLLANPAASEKIMIIDPEKRM
jgi:hypothetical protein